MTHLADQIFVVQAQDKPWLGARTRRSASSINLPRGSKLTCRAGCWLKGLGPVSIPAGDGFIGIGFDGSKQSLDLLEATGGDFGISGGWSWRSRFRTLPPMCYFSPAVAARLDPTKPERAALKLIQAGRVRVVHLPQLDVHFDCRLRVVQAVTTLQIGGAERVALDLTKELNDQAVPTLLVSLGSTQRATLPPPPQLLDLSGCRDRLTALQTACDAFGADILHAHLLAAKDLREMGPGSCPIVMTLHNTSEAWPKDIHTLGGQEVALVLACSLAVESQIRLAAPTRTVWNGIAPLSAEGTNWRERWGVGPRDLVLLALANVRPQKRFELLGAIFERVREAVSDRRCHLWVAGHGTESMSWPEGTRAFGTVEDPASFLRSGDVLLCPSRHEGLSLVQLEALSLGKRVVATRVGGASEVHGLTLVAPDASPETFAAAVIADLKAPATSLPPSFSRTAMAARTARLYRQLHWSRSRSPRGLWLITNNLSTGGAQSSARRLLTELHRRGISVRVAVVEEEMDRPTVGRRSLSEAGVPVWCPARGQEGDMEVICEQIAEQIGIHPPEAVLFWNLIASCKIQLADALLQVPVFDVSPGEMNFDALERYFQHPRTGLPYLHPLHYGKRLAGAVVKYEQERARAEALLGCPVSVIPNGIEVQAAAASRRDRPFTFVTTARINPDKKLELLIEAFRLACEHLPAGCRLQIVGGPDGEQGRYADQLRASSRGLPVNWLGLRQDVMPLLLSADVFVMISEPAGCPNAGLEAMACGLPVVATDHGGAREQVLDGDTGFVTPRNDPSALASRMLQIAEDPGLRTRMGERARLHVKQRFSLGAMADSYLRLCSLRH